ncbi:MAG: LysR substrate-binding domain-containing protein [Planctomycetota bacterium]
MFRPDRPTLRQLEYFVAVAEHLHFGRAAEACSVSQPTLSEQLAGLEAQLRVQLFERDRKGVRATPAARALLPLAQRALTTTDALVDAALGLTGELEGTLYVGVIPTVAPYVLPRIVGPLRASRPKLRLMLREDSTERLLRALDIGELDVLLLSLDAELGSVETQALFQEPFLVAVPSDHRIAALASVPLRELEREPLLLLEEAHCLRSQVLSVCRLLTAPETAPFRASSLVTLVEMVVGGLGVTLLPEMAALALAGRPGLAIVPLAEATAGDSCEAAAGDSGEAAAGYSGEAAAGYSGEAAAGAPIAGSAQRRSTPLADDAQGAEGVIGRSIGVAWRAGAARAEQFRGLGRELATLYMSQ